MCADEAIQPQLTTELDPKGKGVASAPSTADADQAEGLEEEEDEEEDDEDEEEEGSADDMQLAYENLEVARAIYSRQQGTCAKELAGDMNFPWPQHGQQSLSFSFVLIPVLVPLSCFPPEDCSRSAVMHQYHLHGYDVMQSKTVRLVLDQVS